MSWDHKVAAASRVKRARARDGLVWCVSGLIAAVSLPGMASAGTFSSSAVAQVQNGSVTCGDGVSTSGSIQTSGACFPGFASAQASANADGTSTSASATTPTTDLTQAYAAADLTTGQLHARVTTDPIPLANSGRGSAIATISDVMHFTIQGATGSTVTPISFTFSVDGSVSFAEQVDNTTATVSFQVGQARDVLNGTWNQLGGQQNQFVQASPRFDDQFSNVTSTATSLGATLTYMGVGSTFDIPIFAKLQCSTDFGSSCDFLNTATFGYVAQPGVSFTSDSGVFLTAQDTTAVPEPGSLALLAGGLMLGLVYRIRGARPAAS